MAEKKVPKGRKYKCPVCKQSEVSSLLVQHEVYPKRWMHPEYRDEAIEKKRIDTIEQEEKDSMYVKFSEIYGIVLLMESPLLEKTLQEYLILGRLIKKSKILIEKYML